MPPRLVTPNLIAEALDIPPSRVKQALRGLRPVAYADAIPLYRADAIAHVRGRLAGPHVHQPNDDTERGDCAE